MQAQAQEPELILNPDTTDELRVNLKADAAVSISPEDGSISVSTEPAAFCPEVPDTSACEDQIDLEIGTFTLNGATSARIVDQGDQVQISYATRGAWACDRSGLPGTTWNRTNRLPSGTVQVNTADLDETLLGQALDVTLACFNGPKQVTLERQLTVNEVDDTPPPESPQSCINAGRVPPANWTREREFLVDSFSFPPQLLPEEKEAWTDVFSLDFPGGGTTARMVLNTREYAVISINTGDFTVFGPLRDSGRWLTQAVDGGFPAGTKDGRLLVSVSQCPGDFTPQSDPGCRGATFDWKKDDGIADTQLCNLQPNTRYYINFSFVRDRAEEDPVWECDSGSSSQCGVLADPVTN